ncbi:MAG: hypothetical protein WBA74_08370 [Cyclobacteriaceae bacterium]
MKRLFTSILILLPLLIAGCYVESEGPPGPQGFDGRNGRDGQDGLDGKDGEEAYVFEYEFSFNMTDYRELLIFPDDFQALDTDMVLVYFLWEIDDNGNDIWRLLPQNLFTSNGLLQYNFDFTKFDASVFIESEFNPNLLGDSYLNDWIARVVVIPANFTGRVDYSNYEEVSKTFDLKELTLDVSNYGSKPE